jgi:hypothetical protein
MEDEISQHSTNFCWICFAGKMPANNKATTYCTIYNGFKRLKEEHGLVIQQKNFRRCSRD